MHEVGRSSALHGHMYILQPLNGECESSLAKFNRAHLGCRDRAMQAELASTPVHHRTIVTSADGPGRGDTSSSSSTGWRLHSATCFLHALAWQEPPSCDSPILDGSSRARKAPFRHISHVRALSTIHVQCTTRRWNHEQDLAACI